MLYYMFTDALAHNLLSRLVLILNLSNVFIYYTVNCTKMRQFVPLSGSHNAILICKIFDLFLVMCSKKSDEGVMRRRDFLFERAFFYGVCVYY